MRSSIRRTIRSRELRAHHTDAETMLWNRLRNRQLDGHKFVRQEPIGRYIGDFVCRAQRLVVEVDGGQHAESCRDNVRDQYLVGQGYRVLRFWNNEVLSNTDGVLAVIAEHLREAGTESDTTG